MTIWWRYFRILVTKFYVDDVFGSNFWSKLNILLMKINNEAIVLKIWWIIISARIELPVCKLGCVVRMVVVSMLPHAECGPNDRRKDAPPVYHLPIGIRTPSIVDQYQIIFVSTLIHLELIADVVQPCLNTILDQR